MVKRKRAKANPDAYFVQIHHGFLKEKAWRALKMGARCLYIETKSRYNGHNNGDISLSIRQAAEALSCSPSAAESYFTDLQEKRFMKRAHCGFLGVDGIGIASKWILTEIGFRGERPTQDYKNWKPKK